MMTATAMVLAPVGFGALALSMHKNHRDLLGAPPPRWRSLLLQVIGWTLLALSIAPCVARSGWSAGLVLWFGLLTVAVLVVALLLTYVPKRRRRGASSSPLRSHLELPVRNLVR
jgi:hypothetical protein